MASTSWGLTWSAPRMVPTTWVSLRKPSGKRRAQRPVDQAAGQDGLVGWAALPAEERAGDLAGGVHALLDVDGEREEVDALADRLGGGGGDEDHGVADAPATAPRRLAGQLAGLEGQGLVGAADDGAATRDGVQPWDVSSRSRDRSRSCRRPGGASSQW